jgi:hypothetical protein
MASELTLISALVKAQSQMSHAAFDQTNPHFKSKFASLKSVIDAVKPALNANGIAYIQKSVPMDHGIAVETVFYGHGEELSTGPVPVPIDRENAQGFGSALTYAKRYSLAMACGVAADEDDDGNAAAKNSTGRKPQKVTKIVMQEEGIVDEDGNLTIDEGKVRSYISLITEAASADDDAGMKELLDELRYDNRMKTAVWDQLPSNVRTAIRKVENPK